MNRIGSPLLAASPLMTATGCGQKAPDPEAQATEAVTLAP